MAANDTVVLATLIVWTQGTGNVVTTSPQVFSATIDSTSYTSALNTFGTTVYTAYNTATGVTGFAKAEIRVNISILNTSGQGGTFPMDHVSYDAVVNVLPTQASDLQTSFNAIMAKAAALA